MYKAAGMVYESIKNSMRGMGMTYEPKTEPETQVQIEVKPVQG